MIKILHGADFHLDSPFSGLDHRQAQLRRQEQRALVGEMVELCNAKGCDVMLLAGDLFDSDNAYPDTLEALARAFAACRAKIFIAPGNHDYAAPGSAYRTAAWPENVHIFTGEAISWVDLPEKNCRVWGGAFTAPYASGLLEGFRAEAGPAVQLMVLHGDAVTAASPYNAVSRSQIEASGLDYLALGHIHQQSGLQKAGGTHYAWPGCPMGRGFDELGAKGVYLVEAEKGCCQVEFVPLSGRKYEILTVPAGPDPLAAIRAALPADTGRDSYRILLTGEADPVDVQALHRALEDRFFSLSIRDHTTPRVDFWAGCGEDTLRGLFLAELKACYDQADEEKKPMILDAVRLGLAAIEGREAPEV